MGDIDGQIEYLRRCVEDEYANISDLQNEINAHHDQIKDCEGYIQISSRHIDEHLEEIALLGDVLAVSEG